MPARPVIVYPDPALKRVAEPCASVTEEDLRCAEDLIDTMKANERCVGLSAPQIGVSKRIIVVDVTGHPKASKSSGLIAIFDPVVFSSSGSEISREGCLSLPNITANVKRATLIEVKGLGREGTPLTMQSQDFEARAMLHEIDHLDGLLILDRVTSASEIFPRRK